MKCKKCSNVFALAFDNMMIFEHQTLFLCSHCGTSHAEEEIGAEELEYIYWEERE